LRTAPGAGSEADDVGRDEVGGEAVTAARLGAAAGDDSGDDGDEQPATTPRPTSAAQTLRRIF
jgi:hypothetical protein